MSYNTMQVQQLDDNTVFYLAGLPPNSFNTLKQIYNLHAKARLKGQDTIPFKIVNGHKTTRSQGKQLQVP